MFFFASHQPPLPHRMESSLPWGQGLDASRGALCGGCGGRESVASLSKPTSKSKRVRVGGESVMASSSRGRLRDEKEPSSEFARMRRRNRERWLNASFRGDARTAGDSSQAKSYIPTTDGDATGFRTFSVGVDVPSRGGEWGFKSIAPALLGGEPQGLWSSGQVTRAGLWGGCCSAGVCFSSAMARGRGVRLPEQSRGGGRPAWQLFLVLGVLRRRWLASRGGTNLHLAAFALGARESVFQTAPVAEKSWDSGGQ